MPTSSPLSYSDAVSTALRKFPKARRIAVENVSTWGSNRLENSLNLHRDAALYSWSAATVSACRLSLKLQHKL